MTAKMVVKVTKIFAVEAIEVALWWTCGRVGVFIHGVLVALLLEPFQ
jgi:hypothetical protein